MATKVAPQSTATSWIAPDKSEPEKVVAYIQKVVKDHTRALESSANYSRAHEAIRAICRSTPTPGDDEQKGAPRLSSLSFNRTRIQAKKLVAILSNVRPTGNFETSDPDLSRPSHVLSEVYRALWNHPDTHTRETLISLFQYAITGEAYLQTSWEGDPFNSIDPTLTFRAHSVDDIAFAQLPKDKDIQKAYCTVIRHELPIALACLLYPDHSSYFSATSNTPKWLQSLKSGVKKLFDSDALQVSYEESMSLGSMHSQSPTTSESTIDIYEAYIMDFSVNKSGKELELGERGTPSYYKVPYVGQEIPTCLNNADGSPVTRKATTKDCLIYRNRRRVICTENHIISDGPSPWAHGKTPLTRFTLNDWVWDRVGDPVALEGERLNWTIESLYRGFHDMLERQVRPGLKLPNTLSQSTIESYDPRKPGSHLSTDPFTNNTIDTVVPYQLNVVQATALQVVALLKEECDFMTGEPDVRALAKAQQIPSAETFEKFMQLSGPLTEMTAMNIESSLMRVGEQVKSLLMQYCTAARRYHILGRKGLVKEDFDSLDPGNMLPMSEYGAKFSNAIFPSTLNDRVQLYSRKFSYRIIPGSAYQITDIQNQMMKLQLWRDPKNFPISPWTIAEIFGIDIGPIPEGLTTDLEQWEWWQRKQAELGIELQGQGQMAMAQIQLQIQQLAQAVQARNMMSGMAMLAGGQGQPEVTPGEIDGTAGTDLDKRAPGRPPSGGNAPRIESKDGGSRQTVTES